MKKTLALFLFVLFFFGALIPKVGMEQSFKANEILKHFQDHKLQAKGQFSFADFLWLHYSADSKHAKTTKHPGLPSIDFSGAMGYVLPTLAFMLFFPFVLKTHRRFSARWENLYHFSLVRILIAPPRI